MTARFVVVVLAGPSDEEERRTLDLLASLERYEPALARTAFVVDDGARRDWPVPAIPNPRRGRGIGTLGGTCAGTLAGLAHARERSPGAHVLRLDSDALVIAPFAARLEPPPGAGVVGCCRCTPDGAPRDTAWWAKTVRAHRRPLWLWRRPPLPGRHVMAPDRVARQLARASSEPGAHCMAAGCLITAELIEAIALRGWLERPDRWLRTFFGDDVLLGAMAQAVGLSLVDDHEVFGLKHQGLLDTPERLVQRGFGVIHAVKGEGDQDARAYFRQRRAA